MKTVAGSQGRRITRACMNDLAETTERKGHTLSSAVKEDVLSSNFTALTGTQDTQGHHQKWTAHVALYAASFLQEQAHGATLHFPLNSPSNPLSQSLNSVEMMPRYEMNYI